MIACNGIEDDSEPIGSGRPCSYCENFTNRFVAVIVL